MKIYCAHASSFNYRQEFYQPLLTLRDQTGYGFILPYESGMEVGDSKHHVTTAQLVIAEISYPSTGLGIELGWADMHGIPILALCKAGVKHSHSVPVVTDRIEFYDSADRLTEIVRKNLAILANNP